MHVVPRTFVALLALLTSTGLLTAQTGQLATISARDLATTLAAELEAAHIPGAAIAVVSGEETHARGFGIANVETGAAMDAQTLVHLGSLGKLLTALAVTATLDAKSIPASTPVARFLKDLHPRASKATFHQLLSHSAGLRDRPGEDGSSDERALATSAREIADSEFILPADAVFSYSNLGYALAGAALETMRSQPYADAMREALFAPLGMARTTLRPAEVDARPHAIGHRLEAQMPVVVKRVNDTRLWPAGYAWSNAADMSRLLSALVHGGRVYGKQTISVSALGSIREPHVPMPNVFVGGHYGYGLMMARDRTVLMYEHGGTMPGFSSILRIAPGRRLGIAVLTNVDNAPLRRIVPNVMAKALELPPSAPPLREESAVSVEEMQPFVGIYRNRGTAEIAVRDGRVVLMLDGGPPMAVSRIGEDRYLARPMPAVAGPEFVLKRATATTAAYVHFALWAYVRD